MADVKKPATRENATLTEQEKKVIDILREIKYGEIKVIMQDGVPVRVDEIRNSIKI